MPVLSTWTATSYDYLKKGCAAQSSLPSRPRRCDGADLELLHALCQRDGRAVLAAYHQRRD